MHIPSFSEQLDAAMPSPITAPAPDTLPLPPTPRPVTDPLTDPPPSPISDPALPGGATPTGQHPSA